MKITCTPSEEKYCNVCHGDGPHYYDVAYPTSKTSRTVLVLCSKCLKDLNDAIFPHRDGC